MVKADNPAGRLYLILEEAKLVNPEIQTILVWSHVFGIVPEERVKLFGYMSLVNQLYEETISSINSLSALNKELYLKHLPIIGHVIGATNFDVPWSAYRKRLDEPQMYNLALCSDILSSQGIEQPIEQSSLDELSTEIETLLRATEKSDIDDTIRIVILDQLEAIRRSIFEYKLRGPKGLKEALDLSLMAMIRNHDLFKTDSKKEVVQRFSKLIATLDKIVSAAIKVKELGFAAAKLIGCAVGSPDQ